MPFSGMTCGEGAVCTCGVEGSATQHATQIFYPTLTLPSFADFLSRHPLPFARESLECTLVERRRTRESKQIWRREGKKLGRREGKKEREKREQKERANTEEEERERERVKKKREKREQKKSKKRGHQKRDERERERERANTEGVERESKNERDERAKKEREKRGQKKERGERATKRCARKSSGTAHICTHSHFTSQHFPESVVAEMSPMEGGHLRNFMLARCKCHSENVADGMRSPWKLLVDKMRVSFTDAEES